MDCINKYPEVPCNEKVLICHAFIGRVSEQDPSYQVLSDVRCSPKKDIPADEVVEVRTNSPLFTENAQKNDGKV